MGKSGTEYTRATEETGTLLVVFQNLLFCLVHVAALTTHCLSNLTEWPCN